MKSNKYTIYISTFNRRVIKVNGGIPIEVGAARRNNFLYPIHDDSGDNISSLNELYGELTGLYWVWKNTEIHDDDIIGFCHYNKALRISKSDAIKWLNLHENGFIVLKPITAHVHEAEDEVSATVEVLKKNRIDYEAWNRLYDEQAAGRSKSCYSCNMFIANGKEFKEFCCWLFPILAQMVEIVGDKPDVEPNLRRYCAFIGERLLSVYVEARKRPVLCVDKRIKEWWLEYFYPMLQLFHPNKENRFYRYLAKHFGSGSSYRGG